MSDMAFDVDLFIGGYALLAAPTGAG
jgi:hypothetical protein